MTARTKYLTGWCGGPNHDLCPHHVRHATRTAKGVELPELWCSCRCHKEKP